MKRYLGIAIAVLTCFAVATVSLYAEAPSKVITKTPDQLKWSPNPGAPGVMTAPTWGDPATSAHGAFHKFEPGFTAPLHTHSANTRIVVISGTMSITGEDGKEMKFPAGSFFTQPNTYKHTTKCLPSSECMLYLEADAKWDIKPVAAK